VRGFALIGIFLMNVEWFTRPITELGTGVDASQTGLGYLASWFVYTFVQGKFWTMFSLLFGMGFAVMLTRAESTEREFVKPYIRRIIGLSFRQRPLRDDLDRRHPAQLRDHGAGLAVDNHAQLENLAGGVRPRPGDRPDHAIHRPKPEAIWMMVSLLAVVGVLMHFLNRGSIDRYYKWGVVLYSLPFVIGLTFTGVTSAFPQLCRRKLPSRSRRRKPTRRAQGQYVKEREEVRTTRRPVTPIP
jgi:uncharacterized protein